MTIFVTAIVPFYVPLLYSELMAGSKYFAFSTTKPLETPGLAVKVLFSQQGGKALGKVSTMRTDNRGFSLIELLIVVAIILMIAAIAIPNFLRSRIAANQASAVQSCRLINSAQVAYYSSYAQGFASTLLALGPPISGLPTPSAAGIIDSVLASGQKSGYSFSYVGTNPDANGYFQGYNVNANPSAVGQTGSVYYFTDQSYVIRANNSAPASASDSPVAQ